MPLRITKVYRGTETVLNFDADQLLIGRLSSADGPGLDLSQDPCVSRRHALLQVKSGVCWLTDQDSTYGTKVNGLEIRSQGERRLCAEDSVLMGETTLRFAHVPAPKQAVPTPRVEPIARAIPPVLGSDPTIGSSPSMPSLQDPGPTFPKIPTADPALAPTSNLTPNLRILKTIDTRTTLSWNNREGSTIEGFLAMLQDLPIQFSHQNSVAELLQSMIDRVMAVIPSAKRGVLLLCDPERDVLLLKAYATGGEPAVSETLARRALDEKRGFIWRAGQSGDPSRSMREFHMATGICAPIQWKEQAFGVVSVDSPIVTDTFGENDLQFLIAVGQFAGMALAEQQYLAELGRNAKLLDRLLSNFSPRVRAVLLEQAHLGKFRAGCVKSEVTVLFCDIYGFAQHTAHSEAQEVADTINEYIQPLVEVVFRHDGTLDKFVGDAFIAIFGSPEPDSQQFEKAIRAAVAMQEAARTISQLRDSRSKKSWKLRIGIQCGEVFHGFVGGTRGLEFTVIGEAVSSACRFASGAGEGEILISQEIFQHVFNLIRADKIAIETKDAPLTAFRIVGLRD